MFARGRRICRANRSTTSRQLISCTWMNRAADGKFYAAILSIGIRQCHGLRKTARAAGIKIVHSISHLRRPGIGLGHRDGRGRGFVFGGCCLWGFGWSASAVQYQARPLEGSKPHFVPFFGPNASHARAGRTIRSAVQGLSASAEAVVRKYFDGFADPLRLSCNELGQIRL